MKLAIPGTPKAAPAPGPPPVDVSPGELQPGPSRIVGAGLPVDDPLPDEPVGGDLGAVERGDRHVPGARRRCEDESGRGQCGSGQQAPDDSPPHGGDSTSAGRLRRRFRRPGSASRVAIIGAPGRLAQLGERLVYTEEVAGSSPAPPISTPSIRFGLRLAAGWVYVRGAARPRKEGMLMFWLIAGIVLLIIAIAGGAIVHPVLFALAIVALCDLLHGTRHPHRLTPTRSRLSPRRRARRPACAAASARRSSVTRSRAISLRASDSSVLGSRVRRSSWAAKISSRSSRVSVSRSSALAARSSRQLAVGRRAAGGRGGRPRGPASSRPGRRRGGSGRRARSRRSAARSAALSLGVRGRRPSRTR